MIVGEVGTKPGKTVEVVDNSPSIGSGLEPHDPRIPQQFHN